MSEKLNLVTIDGPSGVGKSTVSRKLAAKLGFAYLDTGAMYRAVALKCLSLGIDTTSEEAVSPVLDMLDILFLPPETEEEDIRVLLDKEDVSRIIRTPEISMLASMVSAHRSVRSQLTRMQQKIGVSGRVVAEGRDMGTVVFPEAAWKFYLDASTEERTSRRVKQLRLRGETVNEAEIREQIIKRDQDDLNRSIAPLRAAADAVRINSTRLSIDAVIEQMLAYIDRTGKK